MALETSAVVVTKAVKALIDAEQDNLGIQNIYYGRTEIFPEYPAITVEMGPKSRVPMNLRQWELVFTVFVNVFHQKITTAAINQEENETLAEAVETVLNNDINLGGLVIPGSAYVTRTEPLVIRRAEVMSRVTRLTWEALSREVF